MKKKLFHSKAFQRALSLALTFVMLLSLLPAVTSVQAAEADDTTVYLKPNSNWLIDNARFAAYYWIGSSNGWLDMTDTDGDGYYEVQAPAGISGLIFCRMNPAATANSWDNKWNQTGDLTLPTDGSNCYTVPAGSWDGADNTNWSVYTPDSGDDGDPETPAATYIVAGSKGLCTSEWAAGDTANQMTLNASGKYEKTYSSVAAGNYEFKITDGTWDNSWGNGTSNYALTLETLSNVTITFDADTKEITVTTEEVPQITYYLIGYINGADLGCEADYANMGEYKFVNGQLTATFTQDSYVFVKSEGNANWYMAEAYCTDSTVTLKNTTAGASEKLFVPGNTELTFTLVDNGDDTLTLSYATTEAPEVEIPEGYTAVRVHFYKPEGWGSNINAYVWTGSGALTGYADYNSWPGKAIGKNSSHAGWYDLVVATETPTAFNFIFNDGGNQTADLATGDITGDTELWVVGNDVLREAPGEWSGVYTYTANIHFQKPEAWGSTINAWIWDAGGAIAGYEQYQTTWPGAPIEADSINGGWYNVSVTVPEDTGFSFILNDGAGNQTSDLSTGTLAVKTDLWVVGGEVQTSAPEGWVDPSRIISVPGTFPGNSWDVSSNIMSYDAELGLYIYTFEDVPAANYEYKIAVNKSWSENYGAAGKKDGSNIAVTVPSTQDVTIWYNDKSHYSVNSIDYVFAVVELVGTGIPEDTMLTDPLLSGIYSVTLPLTAGTYSDFKLVYDDGEAKEYVFTEFTLEEDKDVTFYFDPITGIFYHNGSNIPLDTNSILYNSQDETYKSPYGAVAAGEEVTFSIATGEDVTSSALVIKGVGSFPMERNEETGLWSATVTIDSLGEYDYYFALSNGSTVAIYGDDDGYYGEGTVADLTNVVPYDLVVYKAGFETPDWVKNAVIYQIFPDRFFDGDETNNNAQTSARGEVDYEYINGWYTIPENPEQEALLDEEVYRATGAHYGDGEWSNEIYGGDLQGIIRRIDYLKALGVNVIYLNPIFASISNHRYDACDYTEIDPILGTLGDFQELVAVAEANDMHIILDGVFNHVSDDSIYFDRYYKFLGTSEKIGAYPYWAYVYDYMAENGVDQATAEGIAKTYFNENYGITDFSYTAWFEVYDYTMEGTVDNIGLRAGKEVYSYDGWWGYDSMPIIYSTNGSEYQTGNWAEEIIYNQNNSSVTQYWITEGNNGWRLDVANEVSDETWQRFRESVKALNSDVVIIGEIWDDATKYLMGDMYDSVMNYLFRNAVTSYAMGGSAGQTTKDLEKIRERYPEEAFYAMMNLVGSHDTTRILSYLDGIGDDRSDKSIEAAFPTYESTSDLAKARQHLVAFLQFTYPGAPTIYYGDEIGMVGADDPDDRRAMAWGQGSQELVEWYAGLAAIRAAYPALSTGAIEMLDLSNDNLLAFVRSDDANTITVIGNNAQSAQSVTLEGSYVDLISGEAFDGTVPALSGVILVAAEEVKEITVNTAALAPAYDASYTVPARSEVPHAHSYVEGETVEPTCTAAGSTTYTCECGKSYDEAIPALGHDYQNGICTRCGAESSDNPFTDVTSGSCYYDAILWAAGQDITKGYGTSTTFCPDTACTRAQVVTLLWRAAGEPAPQSEANPFRDVQAGTWYYDAVLWAAEEGITNGHGSANTFCPDLECTRAEVVTFLWRYADSPASASGENPFQDVAQNTWYYEAALWAAGEHITAGHGSAETFCPDLTCTRAQVVTFLYRSEN